MIGNSVNLTPPAAALSAGKSVTLQQVDWMVSKIVVADLVGAGGAWHTALCFFVAYAIANTLV